jgi:hypothetical protein
VLRLQRSCGSQVMRQLIGRNLGTRHAEGGRIVQRLLARGDSPDPVSHVDELLAVPGPVSGFSFKYDVTTGQITAPVRHPNGVQSVGRAVTRS